MAMKQRSQQFQQNPSVPCVAVAGASRCWPQIAPKNKLKASPQPITATSRHTSRPMTQALAQGRGREEDHCLNNVSSGSALWPTFERLFYFYNTGPDDMVRPTQCRGLNGSLCPAGGPLYFS
jgi:hypothetical protein